MKRNELQEEVIVLAAQVVRLPCERGPGLIHLAEQPIRAFRHSTVLPQSWLDIGKGLANAFHPFSLASFSIHCHGITQFAERQL